MLVFASSFGSARRIQFPPHLCSFSFLTTFRSSFDRLPKFGLVPCDPPVLLHPVCLIAVCICLKQAALRIVDLGLQLSQSRFECPVNLLLLCSELTMPPSAKRATQKERARKEKEELDGEINEFRKRLACSIPSHSIRKAAER